MQVELLTPCGRATQKRFLKDIKKVMECLIDNICLRTLKVGVITSSGFFIYTWARIAELCGLEEWRVKQCATRIMENGWVDSVQPRERTTGIDNRDNWTGLPSIKRITHKYLAAFGLTEAYAAAKDAAKKSVEKLAVKYRKAVKYLLTPITLLARYRRQRAPTAYPPPL